MNGVYFLLFAVALIGLLPLIIILLKKRRAEHILTRGLTAQATVVHVYSSVRYTHEIVHYQFRDASGEIFKGKLTIEPGKYKKGDQIEVFYLHDNPKRNTVKGSWNSKFIIGFGIAIALAVWFMVYKLYEMVRDGQV
jgi:hypothetical protein